MAKEKRLFGFFALLTNKTMDAITALELYRKKGLAKNTNFFIVLLALSNLYMVRRDLLP